MIDAIRLRGSLELRLVREDGGVEVTTIENLVTTVGKHVIAGRMLAAPPDPGPSHIAVGTNGTLPAITDVALGSESSRASAAPGPHGRRRCGPDGGGFNFLAGDASGALVEAGMFNAAAAGSLIARTTFAVINKGPNDTLQVTWTLTVG